MNDREGKGESSYDNRSRALRPRLEAGDGDGDVEPESESGFGIGFWAAGVTSTANKATPAARARTIGAADIAKEEGCHAKQSQRRALCIVDNTLRVCQG